MKLKDLIANAERMGFRLEQVEDGYTVWNGNTIVGARGSVHSTFSMMQRAHAQREKTQSSQEK